MVPKKFQNSSKIEIPGDEVDLHSLTVDEAIPKLEEFLYRAYQAGHFRSGNETLFIKASPGSSAKAG